MSKKDFAELSGEFSGPICLKTLVLLGSARELFKKFSGAVRAILWLWDSFVALEKFTTPEMFNVMADPTITHKKSAFQV